MNIVVLVIAFWGARQVRDFIKELIVNKTPENAGKGKKLLFFALGMIAGWAVFFGYVYFAGYRIMDKEANMTLAWIIALVPNVLYYGYKLFFTKSALIQ